MLRKRVKRPLGWTLLDENIENVERVKLDRETQRELACLVGEHVFLEYPWTFVNRDVVANLASTPDSPLAAFREKIEAYQPDTFLLGYSSARLIGDEFAICLTEDAKRAILQRNKNLTGTILRKVIGKVIKSPKPWNSLGSDSEVEETFARNMREFFEIEIVLPGKALGSSRTLADRDAGASRDSYAQLLNAGEKFENVDRRCICKSVQTYLPLRETFVQTYPGYPRNAWAQYAYKDTLDEASNEDEGSEEEEKSKEESERADDERSQGKDTDRSNKETEQQSKEKTPLESFLEARSPEMIDAVKYNAEVNLHVDDIENLSRQRDRVETFPEAPTFREQVSLINLNLMANKAISDVSLHARFTEYLAISYVSVTNGDSRREAANEGEFEARVLLWRLNEPLNPQLALQHHREVYSVSFCPWIDELLIAGCSTGQVIIWYVKDYPINGPGDENTKGGTSVENKVPVVRPIVVSDKRSSHRLPVREIRWIPASYGIEPNGKVTRSSASSCVQFVTASEDGTVAVWNLPADFKPPTVHASNGRFDEPLRPTFRLKTPHFSPLCLRLPFVGEKEYAKSLWIGCAEGLIKCGWKEEAEGKSAEIECDISNRCYVHDGPVTEIARSPHLRDVLLTIGGQVFAIWNDDYMESPLFWRRTSSWYTTCCWANEPGVFLLGCQDGSLETWDIKNESKQPIFSQVVSSRPITRLIPLESRAFGEESWKAIGVGDRGGLFRAFKEPEMFRRGEDRTERMDWFEEYAWREVRRKKVFTSWQNDFLTNDPAAIAKRSARRDEERKREAEEARARLRQQQEARLRLKAEKRARATPLPKHVAWKSKEFDRMKQVLLSKKNLVPSELEAKRLPLVVLNAERDAKLEKAGKKIARRAAYFSNSLSVEFPRLFQPKAEAEAEAEASRLAESVELAKSVDDCARKFAEIRRIANETLAKSSPP